MAKFGQKLDLFFFFFWALRKKKGEFMTEFVFFNFFPHNGENSPQIKITGSVWLM